MNRMGWKGSVAITGLGTYLPPKILNNEALEKMVETTGEWILNRTGILERRIVENGVATSDLALLAAQRALASAGVPGQELDLIIVCTATPDMIFPATACLVQEKLGAKRAAAFDLLAGCTGFMYGLVVGSQFISSGAYRSVLVIGADALSKIVNWKDRDTCILFGDGAGAALLQAIPEERWGILAFHLGSDGKGGDLLKVEAGGSRLPASHASVDARQHYVTMSGREVFKFAIHAIVDASRQVLKQTSIQIDDVDCFIFHQANIRILEAAADRLKIPMEKVFCNVDRYGNTSSASVPIALDEAFHLGKIRKGSLVLLVGFGAGLTWGSAVMRWI